VLGKNTLKTVQLCITDKALVNGDTHDDSIFLLAFEEYESVLSLLLSHYAPTIH
jgi:hypothetical protein